MRRLKCLHLDIIAFPALFMSREKHGKFHLKHVCPKCPGFRRKMNDVEGAGDCWWYLNWRAGRFDIPKTSGVVNWFRQYFFLWMDLDRYRKISEKRKG